MIPQRLRFFGLHLLASGLIVGIALGLLYLGWYHWPWWYLEGTAPVALLVLGVDVCLGPLVTLLISNPGKPRRELRRDIACVVLVQALAFGYGVHALWQARPLFITFSVDRIEITAANAFDDADVDLARQQGNAFLPAPTRLPTWVWVPLPADPAQRAQIVSQAIAQGKDITSMPQFFRPLAEGRAELLAKAVPLDRLVAFPGEDKQAFQDRLARLRADGDELVAVLVSGRIRHGVMVFDVATLRPLAFLEASIAPPHPQ